MGQLSARIYFAGTDHKDIYYSGNYHEKMYVGTELVWEKLKKNRIWETIDLYKFGFTAAYVVYDIAYGNGVFLYVTPVRVGCSEDGTEWEVYDSAMGFHTINFCNGIFIATCSCGFYMTSIDGRNWKTITEIHIDGKPCTDSKKYFKTWKVYYAGGYYFAGNLRSSDLMQWTTIDIYVWHGAAYQQDFYLYEDVLYKTSDFSTYTRLEYAYEHTGVESAYMHQPRIFKEGGNLILLANKRLYENRGSGFEIVIDHSMNSLDSGVRLFCNCDGYLIYKNYYVDGGFGHSDVFLEYDCDFNMINKQRVSNVGYHMVSDNSTVVALSINSRFLHVRREE